IFLIFGSSGEPAEPRCRCGTEAASRSCARCTDVSPGDADLRRKSPRWPDAQDTVLTGGGLDVACDHHSGITREERNRRRSLEDKAWR
ncbi:MAG: hypothetical protein ACRECN_06260, partial [Methylocella sp.]